MFVRWLLAHTDEELQQMCWCAESRSACHINTDVERFLVGVECQVTMPTTARRGIHDDPHRTKCSRVITMEINKLFMQYEEIMLTVIQNVDLLCIILKYGHFQDFLSLRCVCTVTQQLTYDGAIQDSVLHRCDRRMAHILFQANVRLRDAAFLVDRYGGWNSAEERLIQKRERFKKKCDRVAKQYAGKLWGPQYFDHGTGKFVNTCIYTSNTLL